MNPELVRKLLIYFSIISAFLLGVNITIGNTVGVVVNSVPLILFFTVVEI